jgi:cytochrome P450
MPVSRLDINLYDTAVVANPYPIYEEIRGLGRVVWNETLKCWMVPGFDDCTAVLTDGGRHFSPMNGDPELITWFDAPNMMMVDGSEHFRLRRCLAPLFTRQAVARWKRRVGEVVDELLTPLVDGKNFDLIGDFTMIPTVIVAEMLGIPKESHQDFRRWSHQIVANLSFGHENPGGREAMRQAGQEVNAFLAGEIERRRQEPEADLITAMLRMSEMTDGEIRSAAVLLLLAGYDTTAKLMANCLAVLEEHPDQRQIVAEDLSLVPATVEEVLRWAGVSQMTPRRVVAHTKLAETELRAGDVLYLLHGAANRDPTRWPDPRRFNVRREQKSHHGFGFGPHLCLGASLARLETNVALEHLLSIAPNYQLQDVEYGTSMFARGPDRGVVDTTTSARPVQF